jgi:NAD(P)-dependent dehydrogenase (short-subunit alcohol dehydrogenase family)
MKIAEGRKAIVTGGASGIGLEVGRRLADAGASLALLDVDEARLQAANRNARIWRRVQTVQNTPKAGRRETKQGRSLN